MTVKPAIDRPTAWTRIKVIVRWRWSYASITRLQALRELTK